MVQNDLIACPLVSVICYCRNAKATIRRCIESILAQDYANIEVIVQDGDSTDGTLEILQSFGKRIDLVSGKDDGPGDAMFRAIRRASGEIFITCLSDEALLPQAVSWGERQMRRYPLAGAIYGDHYNIDFDGRIIGVVRPQAWDFTKVLCSEFIPPFCASFFRRTSFDATGLKSYTDCGEYEIWLRMGAMFPIIYVPGLVSRYGVHQGALSCQADMVEAQARGKIKVIKRLLDQPGWFENYGHLKDEAVSAVHTWLVHSYCNMGDWDKACEYYYEACGIDKNPERLYLTGRRLLNHGLELIRDGYAAKAQKYIELALNTLHGFKNFDLAPVHRIYKQIMDPDVEQTRWRMVGRPRNSTIDAVPSDGHGRLDQIIAPEIVNDGLYDAIARIASQDDVHTALEIGSSDGAGSTKAFLSGLADKTDDARLFCMEISEGRFQRLEKRVQAFSHVHCFNTSSVSMSRLPTPEEITQFYHQRSSALNAYPLTQVLQWLQDDKQYMAGRQKDGDGIKRIKTQYGISSFDMVLIDGSEFTGREELKDVYGAKYLLLDDTRGYKNYDNYQRLSRDENYEVIEEDHSLRNGYAVFRRKNDKLSIHFFTIVLNGEPFIRYHLDIFKQLPFQWHWHVVEGVADLKHDTAWSLSNGGRIDPEFHCKGLSVDGTSAYLDQVAAEYPDRVSLYRKPHGAFWDGKREMIDAPMANLPDHCLLWQVDADEIWKVEQIIKAYELFERRPQRSAAYFHCHFFVGPELLTTTPGAYSHHDSYEWLRIWRYRKGMQWKSHEPPCLMANIDGRWVDTAQVSPFTHQETEAAGLVFTHHAYSLESQVRFKESYYGYRNAVNQWRKLQRAGQLPLRLGDYLPWVKDHCRVDHMKRRAIGKNVPPVGLDEILHKHGSRSEAGSGPRIVIDGVIFQLQSKKKQGISRVWSNLITGLARQMPKAAITVLQRDGFSVPGGNAAVHKVPAYSWGRPADMDQDDEMLREACRELNADTFISTYYTRAPGVLNLVMMHDMIPEKLGFDLAQPEWVAKQRAIETADAFVCVSRTTRTDLIEIYPQVAKRPMTVAYNGLDPCFNAPSKQAHESFRTRFDLQGPYVMLVGNRHGYKGGEGVLASLAAIQGADKPTVLCVGGESRLSPTESGLKDQLDIRYIGQLDDHAMAAAYGGALALLVGSRYEGFGLPVIEAMACGCPVIAHDSPAVSEVGAEAVCYADLGSAESLLSALNKVSDATHRKAYIKKGYERIPRFQWAATSRKIGEFIQTLLGRPATLLTAIVSTYNAAQFIEGCLQDLENQTVADRMEVLVIDSASQQDEAAVVRAFQTHYPNIKYIRTPERETIYQAWNRGIKFALGKYVTNANTDDRHRGDAFEQMTRIMEQDESVALVYADVIKTRTANETFDQCTPSGRFRWHDWNRKTLLTRGCFIGPQPVWRKKIHEEYGYFDENYEVSSDFEFWLRISQTNDFYHIATPLGLYLDRQDSVEHANFAKKAKEDTQILQCYQQADANNILIGAIHQADRIDNPGDSLVLHHSGMDSGEHVAVKLPADEKFCQGGQHMNLPVTYLKAVKLLLDEGQQEAASWAMRKLVEDFPQNARLHNEMAVLAYEQGDRDNALKHFKQAVHLAPDNIHYLKSFGDFCYVVQNDVQGALAQYEKVLDIDPDNIEILMMSGHVSVTLHRYREARNYYMQVLRLNPNNQEVREIIEKLSQKESVTKNMEGAAEGLYEAARAKLQDGDRGAAISMLQQLVSQDVAHGLAHNDLGVLHYENGEVEAALKHYQMAVKLMPENETFQKNLADIYWAEMRDHQRAMEHYVQVLRINPKDVEALLACGQICINLGKRTDAIDFINSALETEPWNENARVMLIQLKDFSGKEDLSESENHTTRQFPQGTDQDVHETSINELRQRLAESPNDARLHNNLGVMHYEAGDKKKALASYQQAVRLAPNDPNYRKNLADFYFVEEGRAEDAMRLYLDVLSLNPEDVEALNATGMICIASGKLDDARYFFERALGIEPWNDVAARALTSFSENSMSTG